MDPLYNNTKVHDFFSHFHPHEEKLIIHGGKRLSGHVTISGSKNSSLALLAATLCCNGISKFQNVPVSLSDIEKMILVLQSLGARFEYNRINGEMVVETNGVVSAEPDHGAVSEIRGGFFVLGPLLARFGEAVVALPGGCNIGARPVDLYIRGLQALGALVEIRDGKVYAECGKNRRLRGGSFYLDYPSVGATNTLMMAATLAHGVTKLSNVAQEPEVNDLAQFLIKCGAEIDGAGTSNLLITGKHKLHGCDNEHVIMPDRIEAGTFAIAAAITRSCFSISPVVPSHLTSLLDKLKAAGCKITQTAHDTIQVSGLREENGIDMLEGGIDIQTGPYPEFPTDLQPQMLALLTTCNGRSLVRETVFEGRMGHVRELQKMGAKIHVSGNSATILGESNLCGSSGVFAHDLRGGASLVLAGLAASGTTEIDDVFHIDRGYEDLQGKLQSLGANVKRSSFNYYNI